MTNHGFDLDRFVQAQDADSTYQTALTELRRGRKRTHWMWFVFPQLAGLGRSEISRRFAISSIDEARAYASHPVLGGRLVECAQTLLDLGGSDPDEIFGALDSLKLRSSMTLFARTAPEDPVFASVIGAYFQGIEDPWTAERT